MLNDLLVLGQIPGTKIQITFKQLLFCVALYLLIYILRNYFYIKSHESKHNFDTKIGQQLSLL